MLALNVDSYFRLQMILGAGRLFYAKSKHESQVDIRNSKTRYKLKIANAIHFVGHKEMDLKRAS
jgi:hypothetical protein